LAPHRRPRPGLIFTLLRLAGLLLIVAGLLLLALGGIGFVIALVRSGPSLVDALQHLDQQMAGLILIIALTTLAVFPVVGVVGVILAGLGLVLRYLATERGGPPASLTPDQERPRPAAP